MYTFLHVMLVCGFCERRITSYDVCINDAYSMFLYLIVCCWAFNEN